MNVTKQRILCTLLSLIMIVVLLSTVGTPVSAIEVPATNWVVDGNPTEPKYEGGVYQIGTPQELAWFAQQGAKSSYFNYVLTADIDLSAHEWSRCYVGGYKFFGTFDGAGHTISGLVLNSTGYTITGFIGILGSSGVIKNLSVVGSIAGGTTTGGIVGWNDGGTVENVSFSGTVISNKNDVGGIVARNGGVVTDASFDGSVIGSSSVGGIVGYLESGVIHNAKTAGTVTSTSDSSYAGGIVGVSWGKTINTYNTATVLGKGSVGGIVGDLSASASGSNAGIVQNCYNAGAVTVVGTSNSEAGGIAGSVSESGKIQNCYNDGMVTGETGDSTRVGGVAGDSAGTIENSFWLESSATAGVFTGTGEHDVASFNANGVVSGGGTLIDKLNTWVTDNSLNYPAPSTWVANGTTPTFDVTDWIADGVPTAVQPTNSVYRITTASQLAWVAEQVNSGTKNFSGETVQVASPIVLHAHNWVPIGTQANPFMGTFDADRQSITCMFIDSKSDNIGLFGAVGSDGTIKNLYISGAVSGVGNVGGAVGSNAGTLVNVHSAVTVNGSGSNVGGVVGTQTDGIIANSLNVNRVTGATTVGGVVGNLASGASLQNSYNRGTVTGSTVGGVVGNNGGTLTDGYFLVSSAEQGVGSGSGETVLSFTAETVSTLLDKLNAGADTYNTTNPAVDAKPWLADGEIPQSYQDTSIQTNGGFPLHDNPLPLQVLSVEGVTGGTLTKMYGDEPFTQTVTVTSGGSVEALTFASSDSEVATIDENSGEITINKAGETNIIITSPEVPDEYAETIISYTLTVNLAEQVLEFNTTLFGGGYLYYTSVTYGVAPFTHAATLSSGSGAITYKSSDPEVASVNETTGEVQLHRANKENEDGQKVDVYITATAAAVPGYYKEATESYELTVSKATIPTLLLPEEQTIVHGRGLAGITSDDNVVVDIAYGEKLPLTITWYSDSKDNILATDEYVNRSVGERFSLYYRYAGTHPGYHESDRYGQLVTFTVVEATDVNGDGATSLADLQVVAHEDNYNKAVSDAEEPKSDVNADGKVNFTDLALVRNHEDLR